MKPKKLVHGVGINDAGYDVRKRETIEVDGKRRQKTVGMCRYYQTWSAMIARCYSAKVQERYPTYAGCTVSEEWHTFSAFKDWMMAQDWEGLELDKDILVKGNQVYSPKTCVFVSRVVNNFTTDRGNDRGKWLIGVYWDKGREKFLARCRNPFTKKKEHLGYFTCEQAAHEAWRKRKQELSLELAAIQTDERVAKALIDRYSKPEEP